MPRNILGTNDAIARFEAENYENYKKDGELFLLSFETSYLVYL